MNADGGRNILWGDCQPSLLTSICNNGSYRDQIKKRTRTKMVPVLIVSIIVCLKNSRQKTVWIRMEEEKYYGKIANHHYLPQYVIMVDIGNIFRNTQELKRYWFPLFLLCV